MTLQNNPKKALMLGALWTVGTRWSIKGIGFLNTIVMARLLVPADYGIVAMAMLVVGLIQAFLDFGATTALLRKGELTREEIDSAWTLRVIEASLVSAILMLASPLAAMYFKEPRVMYVLWVLAVCVGLAGAANIGVTLAQKAFNFSVDFRIQVIGKLVGVVMTVSFGFLLRDYRALVIGIASSYMTGIVLSFVLHPYRPRFTTARIGEIWAVTKWLMVAGVGGFVMRKGDELIAGGLGSSAQFGLYNVGSDLGQMPTGEVGPAMLRAFLPVLSSMKAQVAEINAAVLKTLAAVNTITLPIGFGFAAVAWPATSLILGSHWIKAAEFVAAFSIASTLQVMANPYNTLLVFRGHTKAQSQIVWLEFLAFLAAAAMIVPHFSFIGLVWARMIGNGVNIAFTALAVRRHCEVHLREGTRAIARPLIGAVLMYGLVREFVTHVEGDLLQLVGGMAIGAVFYASWAVATWWLAGRPAGLERVCFDFLQQRRA